MNPRLNHISDPLTVFKQKIEGKLKIEPINGSLAEDLNAQFFIAMIDAAVASYTDENMHLEKQGGLLSWVYPHGSYGRDQATKFREEAVALTNPADIFKKIQEAIKGSISGQLFKKHLAYHFLTVQPFGLPRRCENDYVSWEILYNTLNERHFFNSLTCQPERSLDVDPFHQEAAINRRPW